MVSINPYLNFLGNTEEAFNFYKSVFGGEFTTFQRFRDIPGSETMPAGDLDKIMHVSLPIGNGHVLMATDALESAGHKLTVGNNINISINVDSEQEADHIFNGLSAGGKIEMAMEKTFWGAYFGMFEDKFGIKWMVNYDYDQK